MESMGHGYVQIMFSKWRERENERGIERETERERERNSDVERVHCSGFVAGGSNVFEQFVW